MLRPFKYAGMFALLLFALGLPARAGTPPSTPSPANGLVWDAMMKQVNPKPGVDDVDLTFSVTNRSTKTITIQSLDTSCGCTVAELPSEPWPLKPGEGGEIKVNVDLQGKSGTLTKSIFVNSTAGPRVLMVKVIMPELSTKRDNGERVMNLMQASKNRQLVFQGKCVTCHVQPGAGKLGQDLFAASCGICHEAEHRATMVPDLRHLKVATDEKYWDNWIRHGKPNSLMPAFEKKQGGPLNEAQINSLVTFLSASKDFPSNFMVKPAAQKH